MLWRLEHRQGLRGGLTFLVVLLSVFAAPARGRVYTLASGSAQGVYLPLANDLAAVAKRAGMEIRVLPSEGSKQNLAWLAEGRADLALAQSDIAWNAYSGKDGFLRPVTSLRVIAPLYTEAIHILIRRTLYIHKVDDLRGKRVAVGPAGGGTEANAAQMLGAAGITPAEIDARHLSVEEAMAALRRGEIDAAFMTSGVPSAAVTNVLADGSASLLEPDRDFLERLRRIFPFYRSKNIETSDYPHLEEQVTTAGVQALLVGRSEIPEAIVGRLVRALSASKMLRAKYRLPAPGEGISDLEIPVFKEARTIQLWFYGYEWLIGMAVVFLVLVLIFGFAYFQRRTEQQPRRPSWYRFLRAGIGLVLVWIFGSLVLYRVEHRINDNYANLGRSLWSGLITLYSLSNKEPLTLGGRVVGIVMFIFGLGSLTWIAEKLASHYVEEKLLPLLHGGFAKVRRMKNHYVIAGWNEKGIGIIKQLHSEDLEEHRHIIILAPKKATNLPTQSRLIDIEQVEQVNEDNLLKANIQEAHSVIILADSNKARADTKTILVILAIRKICSDLSKSQVPVTAEIVDSRNVALANYAGTGHTGTLEVVSYQDIGKGLLAQATVNPGLSSVYKSLLELGRNNSEIHRAEIPKQLVEKRFSFDRLVRMGLDRPHGECVLPIAIQRKGDVYVNPTKTEHRSLEENDIIFALCDSPRHLEKLLQDVARA